MDLVALLTLISLTTFLTEGDGVGAEPTEIFKHGRPVAALTISSDGEVLASADGAAKEAVLSIIVWSAQSGRPRFVLRGHSRSVNGLSFSPDNQTLASVSFDGTLRFWNLMAGQALATVHVSHVKELADVHFLPGKKLLVTRAVGEHPLLWDVSDWKNVQLLKEQPLQNATPTATSTFSKDGRLVATATGYLDKVNHYLIREVPSGKQLLAIEGHSDVVLSMAFTPDAKTLATGYLYSTNRGHEALHLWEVSSGKHIATLKDSKGGVFTLAFAPDGQILASGHAGGYVMLWDVRAMKRLAVVKGHTHQIERLLFSPDGTSLFTASQDGTVKLWHLATLLRAGE